MTTEHYTHIAHDRLGPCGRLLRACDRGPLAPLPPLYELRPDHSDHPDVRLVFCRACVAVARALKLRDAA